MKLIVKLRLVKAFDEHLIEHDHVRVAEVLHNSTLRQVTMTDIILDKAFATSLIEQPY